MEHELLIVLAVERIDQLLVVAGAQGGHDQGLGLAAGEQRRAVGAAEDAHFRDDLTHLIDLAAVDANAGVQDVATHDVGFQFLEYRAQLVRADAGRVGVRLAELVGGLGLGRGDRVLAFQLGGNLEGGGEILADDLLHLGLDGVGVFRLEVEGFLGRVLGQFDDRVDHRLHAGVGEHDALQDVVFAHLLDLGLDHHDRVGGAGDHQVHPAVLHLVAGGVENILTVHIAHAGAGDGAHERRA